MSQKMNWRQKLLGWCMLLFMLYVFGWAFLIHISGGVFTLAGM